MRKLKAGSMPSSSTCGVTRERFEPWNMPTTATRFGVQQCPSPTHHLRTGAETPICTWVWTTERSSEFDCWAPAYWMDLREPRRLQTDRRGHAESMDSRLFSVRTCMFVSPTHAFEQEKRPRLSRLFLTRRTRSLTISR